MTTPTSDREALLAGEAAAEALRIAERHLDRLGWKYTMVEVGETARVILRALAGDPRD